MDVEDIFKEIEDFNKKPLYEKLNVLFIRYLKAFEQKKEIIEFSEKINWDIYLRVFYNEFKPLWNKLLIPKHIEGLEEIESAFASGIIEAMLYNIFYTTFKMIKEEFKKRILQLINSTIN